MICRMQSGYSTTIRLPPVPLSINLKNIKNIWFGEVTGLTPSEITIFEDYLVSAGLSQPEQRSNTMLEIGELFIPLLRQWKIYTIYGSSGDIEILPPVYAFIKDDMIFYFNAPHSIVKLDTEGHKLEFNGFSLINRSSFLKLSQMALEPESFNYNRYITILESGRIRLDNEMKYFLYDFNKLLQKHLQLQKPEEILNSFSADEEIMNTITGLLEMALLTSLCYNNWISNKILNSQDGTLGLNLKKRKEFEPSPPVIMCVGEEGNTNNVMEISVSGTLLGLAESRIIKNFDFRLTLSGIRMTEETLAGEVFGFRY
ncbi:MAG: hypothetical protein QW728_01770 [Thermoplasmata archaeon]